MKRLLCAAFALFLLGAAPADGPDFGYDRSAPLALLNGAPAVREGVALRDIRFRSGTWEIAGTVVRPPAEARPAKRPAVLFVHWLGDPKTTNRSEFLPDAVALAKRGAVSLLVDAMWAQDSWFSTVRSTGTDYAQSIAQVVALRRALDVLLAQPDVDPNRIAYVGHDFGAMYGALVAGVDPRARYYVFMTPAIEFWDWYLLGTAPPDPAAYVAQMSALDLPRWLPRATMAGTLLQFAERDEYVARSTAISVRNTVPDRDRTMKTYDADHALISEAATQERRMWLAVHLGLP